MPTENMNNQSVQLDIFDTKTAKISESGAQLQLQLAVINKQIRKLQYDISSYESDKSKKSEEYRDLNGYLKNISLYETDRAAEKEANYLESEIDSLTKDINKATEELNRLEKERKKLEAKIAKLNIKTYQSALQYAQAQRNQAK